MKPSSPIRRGVHDSCWNTADCRGAIAVCTSSTTQQLPPRRDRHRFARRTTAQPSSGGADMRRSWHRCGSCWRRRESRSPARRTSAGHADTCRERSLRRMVGPEVNAAQEGAALSAKRSRGRGRLEHHIMPGRFGQPMIGEQKREQRHLVDDGVFESLNREVLIRRVHWQHSHQHRHHGVERHMPANA